LAGSELSAGAFITDVPPEHTAAELRLATQRTSTDESAPVPPIARSTT
jgi:galactose-1-phosphate uridylyltransferase